MGKKIYIHTSETTFCQTRDIHQPWKTWRMSAAGLLARDIRKENHWEMERGRDGETERERGCEIDKQRESQGETDEREKESKKHKHFW